MAKKKVDLFEPLLYKQTVQNFRAQTLDVEEFDVTADRKKIGTRPLHLAVGLANIDIVKLVVSSVDAVAINRRDSRGQTPLMVGVRASNGQAVSTLLSMKADVNLRDVRGVSPLAAAIRKYDARMVRELIAAGADVNSRDKNWNSCLLTAVVYGDKNIVKILVDSGARLTWADRVFGKIFKIAERGGSIEIRALLRGLKK